LSQLSRPRGKPVFSWGGACSDSKAGAMIDPRKRIGILVSRAEVTCGYEKITVQFLRARGE
jgi:hypothetical protein